MVKELNQSSAEKSYLKPTMANYVKRDPSPKKITSETQKHMLRKQLKNEMRMKEAINIMSVDSIHDIQEEDEDFSRHTKSAHSKDKHKSDIRKRYEDENQNMFIVTSTMFDEVKNEPISRQKIVQSSRDEYPGSSPDPAMRRVTGHDQPGLKPIRTHSQQPAISSTESLNKSYRQAQRNQSKDAIIKPSKVQKSTSAAKIDNTTPRHLQNMRDHVDKLHTQLVNMEDKRRKNRESYQ